MRAAAKILTASSVLTLLAASAFADTVYVKGGREIMGIVVEEYKDRVVISTYEGEKPILKRYIERIDYDLPEQNLVRFGDSYVARREYEKAYFYYEKAYKENQEYAVARNKMNYVMGYLFRTREKNKQTDIKRRQEFENWPPPEAEEEPNFQEELEEKVGIRIKEEENRTVITRVIEGSPAEQAGLKTGDRLSSVWGRFTGYMSEEDVAHLLLEESAGETKVDIERDLTLRNEPPYPMRYKDIIGGRLEMLMDGLTLTEVIKGGPGEKAGFVANDLILDINGTSMRYVPLSEAVRMLKDKGNPALTFTVRRNVTLWRKE